MNPTSEPFDQQRQQPTPFKFSPEDALTIQECNREAFYKRCLPCSAGLGGLTFYAVKAGYLKPHATWGPTPKVLASVFLGYFIGKISYQTICAEKLMANPNSQLGAMLRARRRQGVGGSFQDTLALELPGLSIPEESASNVYRDDRAPNTFTDLDTDRPYHLDDSYRSGFDAPQRPEDFVLPPQAAAPNSYEEMRRRNREDFEKKSKVYRSPEDQRQYYPSQRPPAVDVPEPIDRYKPTNIYGDIFDK